MPKVKNTSKPGVATPCANIKSRKFPQVRCTYPATNGEYCCRHWKHPRRFEITRPAPVTRSIQGSVRKIQAWWRLRYGIYLARDRSLAFFSRNICHNETEIASFEPLSEIPRDYFFAFEESKKFWGFDIRSLVIQYEADGKLENPYTKEQCGPKIVEQFRIRVDALRRWKKSIHYEQFNNLTPTQSWNLRVLDVCLRLDMLGYRVATHWFTDLDITQQRRLYIRLYQIWNEQLTMTAGLQERIVPEFDLPANRLFKWSPTKVHMRFDINTIRRTNLNIIERLISSAVQPSDKTLGAMYTVMGICDVSNRCRQAYPWLC